MDSKKPLNPGVQNHPEVKIGSQRLDHNAAKTGILRLAGYSMTVTNVLRWSVVKRVIRTSYVR